MTPAPDFIAMSSGVCIPGRLSPDDLRRRHDLVVARYLAGLAVTLVKPEWRK